MTSNVLGTDQESPEAQRALRQLEHDSAFLDGLIKLRTTLYPDTEGFAESISLSTKELKDFENDPLDSSIAFLRIYTHALDVTVEHIIIK